MLHSRMYCVTIIKVWNDIDAETVIKSYVRIILHTLPTNVW